MSKFLVDNLQWRAASNLPRRSPHRDKFLCWCRMDTHCDIKIIFCQASFHSNCKSLKFNKQIWSTESMMTTEIFSPQWKQNTERRRDKTCTISGESSPHMCNPRTFLVFAHTISFMKIRSGSPERVAFKGLKFAVKTSTSPYSLTACKNPWNDESTKRQTGHVASTFHKMQHLFFWNSNLSNRWLGKHSRWDSPNKKGR